MAKIEVKITLDKLIVVRELDEPRQNRKDGIGSEPYLWITFFSISGDKLFTEKPVDTYTPIFSQLRREFKNNVRAGNVLDVPPILKSWVDTIETLPYSMVGVIVLLMEQDRTPEDAIHKGLLAFASSINDLLNGLVRERVSELNLAPITEEEIQSLKDNLKDKIKKAIRRSLSLNELILNQDDNLGFTYQIWTGNEMNNNPVVSFPRIHDMDEEPKSKNVFELTGAIRVREPRPIIPGRCDSLKKAVSDKKNEIKGYSDRIRSLQEILRSASPSQKADIIRAIDATVKQLENASTELPTLEDALNDCLANDPQVDTDGFSTENN